jgi:hypothetical protein
MGIKTLTLLVIALIVFVNAYLILYAQGVNVFDLLYVWLADFASRAGLQDPLILILFFSLVLAIAMAIVFARMGKEI